MSNSRYIELIIESQSPKAFVIRARDYTGREAAEQFELDLNSIPLKSLLHQLDECLKHKKNHRLNSKIQKELGSFLFNKIMIGDVYTLYDRCRSSYNGYPLKIRLNVEAEALIVLPWEIMNDSKIDSWLSRDGELTFSRFASLREGSRKPEFNSPLDILLALSNPLGLGKNELNLEKEREKVTLALRELIENKTVILNPLEEVTLQNMYQRLVNNVNVLHFSGHGGHTDEGLVMLLENDEGRIDNTPFDRFISLLSGLDRLIAVVLDACELAAGAHQVLGKKVPIVIAMRSTIFDETATLFFEEFYRAMTYGFAIDEAITYARNNLVSKYGEDLVDWFTPIIYLSTLDSTIISKSKSSTQEIPTPRGKRWDNLIALRDVSRFVGRRTQIRQLRDKLYDRDTRIIVVEGLSGDGKTVLVSKVIQQELQAFKAVFSHTVTTNTSFENLLTQFNEFLEGNEDISLSNIWNRPDLSIEAKINAILETLTNNRYLSATS